MAADKSPLTVDESNRVARYATVKGRIQQDVNAEIVDQANSLDESEMAQAAEVGRELKRKTLTEVAGAENELERLKAAARVSQVIDYLFYLVYGLISLQIALDLLGA